MPLPPIAADSCAVVVTGQFRPVDISPIWLHDHNLIGRAELDNSSIELLIPNEAVNFNAGWLHCQATPQSWQFDTPDETAFESLRDLVVNLLREKLNTPISQLGINRSVHFTASDFESWHAVGDGLVNNTIWNGLLSLPGMRAVTYWGTRSDNFSGRVQIQVEPSLVHRSSVFVAFNDHYDLTYASTVLQSREELQTLSDDAEATTSKIPIAIEVLEQNWENSMRLSNQIIERVAAVGVTSD
jgi:hypothetical protein